MLICSPRWNGCGYFNHNDKFNRKGHIIYCPQCGEERVEILKKEIFDSLTVDLSNSIRDKARKMMEKEEEEFIRMCSLSAEEQKEFINNLSGKDENKTSADKRPITEATEDEEDGFYEHEPEEPDKEQREEELWDAIQKL